MTADGCFELPAAALFAREVEAVGAGDHAAFHVFHGGADGFQLRHLPAMVLLQDPRDQAYGGEDNQHGGGKQVKHEAGLYLSRQSQVARFGRSCAL